MKQLASILDKKQRTPKKLSIDKSKEPLDNDEDMLQQDVDDTSLPPPLNAPEEDEEEV